MKLWLLKRFTETPVYDVNNGFVIRAETENAARDIASQQRGDEGPETWTDIGLSTCEELTADGEIGVVLRDFNAG
jgi:hypothetical protein